MRQKLLYTLSWNALELYGLLTKHCRLRENLMGIGLSDNNECRFCGEKDTPIHLPRSVSSLQAKEGNALTPQVSQGLVEIAPDIGCYQNLNWKASWRTLCNGAHQILRSKGTETYFYYLCSQNSYLLFVISDFFIINVTKLLNNLFFQLFNAIRRDRPQDLQKVLPIEGDITQPELDISASDRNMLARTVNIVFHSAATVKFDEKLKLSVTINVLGTQRLVELCKKMSNIEALVRKFFTIDKDTTMLIRHRNRKCLLRHLYWRTNTRIREIKLTYQ